MKTKTSPEPEPPEPELPTENVSTTVENNVNNIITLTTWQERQESFKQEVHLWKIVIGVIIVAAPFGFVSFFLWYTLSKNNVHKQMLFVVFGGRLGFEGWVDFNKVRIQGIKYLKGKVFLLVEIITWIGLYFLVEHFTEGETKLHPLWIFGVGLVVFNFTADFFYVDENRGQFVKCISEAVIVGSVITIFPTVVGAYVMFARKFKDDPQMETLINGGVYPLISIGLRYICTTTMVKLNDGNADSDENPRDYFVKYKVPMYRMVEILTQLPSIICLASSFKYTTFLASTIIGFVIELVLMFLLLEKTARFGETSEIIKQISGGRKSQIVRLLKGGKGTILKSSKTKITPVGEPADETEQEQAKEEEEKEPEIQYRIPEEVRGEYEWIFSTEEFGEKITIIFGCLAVKALPGTEFLNVWDIVLRTATMVLLELILDYLKVRLCGKYGIFLKNIKVKDHIPSGYHLGEIVCTLIMTAFSCTGGIPMLKIIFG